VFEIGCGYDRITKAILQQFPNVKIQAIDLSPQQIIIARRYANSDRVEFSVGKIQDLDVSERNYDLVIAVSVLLHIPFHDIDGVVMKMVKMSKKHIVNVDLYGSAAQMVLRGYVFAHDYTSLYKKFGVKEVQMVPIPKRPMYGISFGFDSGLRIFRRKERIQCLWHATTSLNT